MNQTLFNQILLIKRLYGHLQQVFTEFLYSYIKLKIRFPVAIRFLVMRLLMPFGFSRGWDVPGQPSSIAIVDELRTSGIAELQPLEPVQVNSLRSFFCARMGAANGGTYASLGEYFEHARETKVQRPSGIQATGKSDCAITQILCQDYYIDIAAAFLGLDRSRLIASGNMDALIRLDQPKVGGTHGYDDALEFHRDIDNYRFVKMFVYLTDCTLNGGHHEIYLQSHRYAPFALGSISRYSNQEIEHAIPETRLRKVVGKAGYAFVENTYAFHRGTKPLNSDRLILNLEYMEDNFIDYYKSTFKVPVKRQPDLSA